MSLRNATLTVGSATYGAPSGGTSKSFSDTGNTSIKNGVEIACFSDPMTARDSIRTTVRPPALQKDGSYSMMRVNHKVYTPRSVTINGVSVQKIETVEVIYSIYPDADDARKTALRNYAAAIALDSDITNVMATGSTA